MAESIVKYLDNIKKGFKVNLEKVYISNSTFQLFYQITTGILFTSAGLVTMQQLLGKHIQCIAPPKEDIRTEAIEQYCFIMSTYTVPKHYGRRIGIDVPHYGVGPHTSQDEVKYHAYYQWVPFVLFFQALFFLIPHLIWKAHENGLIKIYCNLKLVDEIKFKDRDVFIQGEKYHEKLKMMGSAAEYFTNYINYNKTYAYGYILCEILNFLIVIANIFLTDAFLGYQFSTYGIDVFNYLSEDPENRSDPMAIVFPKVTKCDFMKFGPSGNLVKYDILCVLALNIVNEKIYAFLWFWFVFLGVVGGLTIIYRFVVLLIPGLRNIIIRKQVCTPESSESLEMILPRIGYCDWFVLKRISDNVSSIRFSDFCNAIYEHLIPHKSKFVSTRTPSFTGEKEKDLDDPLLGKKAKLI